MNTSRLLKTAILSVFFFLSFIQVKAQVTVTLGTGTSLSSTNGHPTAYENYWYQNWQQFLYTKAELNALGIFGGTITSLAMQISSLPDQSYFAYDYNVKLGSTLNTSLSSFTTTGLTNVFGPSSVSAMVGWNTITFATPFVWDGTSNIIVDLRQTGNYGNANASTYYTTTAFNSVLYAFSNTNNVNFWASGPSGNIITARPNIKFTINPSTPTRYHDFAMVSWVSPIDNDAPSAQKDITVKFCNNDTVAQDSIPLKYSVNNGISWTTGMYLPTVNPGDTITFTFPIKANMPSNGTYNCKAQVNFPNDSVTFNNAISLSVLLCQSMSGHYTIGSGGDFNTIPDALSAMTTCGTIGDSVFFDILPGTYNTQLLLSNLSYFSANKPLIIQSATGNPDDVVFQYAPSSSSYNYVFGFSYSNYIIIRNLTLKNTSISGYNSVINFTGLSSYDQIINCKLYGNPNSTSTSAWQAVILINGLSASKNKFVNNTIYNGAYSIYCLGAGSGYTVDSTDVIGNNCINPSVSGIYFNYASVLNCQNNTVYSNNVLFTSVKYLMYLGNSSNSKIDRNKLVYEGNNASSVYGLYMNYCTGTAFLPMLITNNMFSVINNNASYANYGIFANYSNYHYVSNNSLYVNSPYNSTAFYNYGGSNSTVINNIFQNKGIGVSLFVSPASSLYQCDYNNYYVNSGYLASWGGTSCTTLANLKSISGTNTFSQNIFPDFYSQTDLHTSSLAMNNLGVAIPSVPFDFDGQARSATTPDLGADEYTPLAIDAGLLNPSTTSLPCSGVSNPVTYTLKNYGTSTLTAVQIGWKVNGVSQTAYTWNGSLASGAVTTITVGNYSFASGTSYTVKAFINSANSTTDLNPVNDTATTSIATALSGTFIVGVGVGANYSTLQAAVSAITNQGVCGPVVFKIQDGTYDEYLSINAIPGASAINTITFESMSADTSKVSWMHYASSNTDNYLVQLNGASYITFRNISFKPTSSYYTTSINLLQGSNSNKVVKCHLLGKPDVTSATNYHAQIQLTSNCNDNIIDSNMFDFGSYSVFINGNSSLFSKRNIVSNNSFKESVISIYFYYADSSSAIGNTVYNSVNNISFNQLYFSYSNYTKINNNKLLNYSSYVSSVYFNTCNGALNNPIQFYNNYIYREANAAGTIYGLMSYYTNYLNVYYNTFKWRDTYVGAYPLYFNSGGNNNLKNNNILNLGGGYTYYTASSSYITTTDYNNLYTTGTNLAYYAGNRTTLALLKSYSGKETNSKNINANFAGFNDYHLYDATLNNSGNPIAGITTDIDGETRNASTPDIGCDEFSMLANDAVMFAINAPSITTSAGIKPIKVAIKNFGTTNLTSLAIAYKLDNNANVNYSWSGNLTSLSVDSLITIGNSFVSLGAHTLKVWCSSPNGLTDQNTLNDTLLLNFSAIPKPEISVIPASINASIVGCNDSITVPLKIKNIGSANLTYSVLQTGSLNATNDFLVIDHSKGGKANFAPHAYTTTSEAGFSAMPLNTLKTYRVIYFEPDWGTYTNLTNNMTNLSSYVQAGGVAIINIAGNIGNLAAADPYGTDYNTTYSSSENFPLPNHRYITGAGFGGSVLTTSLFNNWSSTDHGNLTNYPANSEVILSNSNGVSMIRYPWGAGSVILTTLTVGWTNTTTPMDNLIEYGYYLSQNANASWISMPSSSGTILPADSITLNVKLRSVGLASGVYTGSIKINSNDSSSLETNVPVTFTVTGTPQIAMTSNPFNKGNTFISGIYYDSLKVYNQGCDTLRITSITSNNSALLPLTTSRIIPPNDSNYIALRFIPTTAGNFTANVTMLNNVSTYVLTYNSTVTLPAIIQISPNPIVATIPYCGDSILFPVTITNTGSGTLSGTVSGGGGDSVKILALTNGYYSTSYYNLVAGIQTYYPKYTITESTTTTVAGLQAAMVGKDIILVPYMNNDVSSQYTTFAATLQSFVNNGGTVIFTGQYYQNIVFNTGLITGTLGGYSSGNTVNVINSAHTITSGVPTSFTHYANFGLTTLGLTNLTRLVTYNSSYDIAAVKTYGNGQVIYIGSLFDNTSTIYDQKMMGNALKYVAETKNPSWMAVPNPTFSATPGNPAVVNVRLRSLGKQTGAYYGTVKIVSNALTNSTVIVPCTLNIQNILQNEVNLGNDTIVCGSKVLNAGSYTNYIWSTGATTPTITVTSGNSYSVTVSNGGICSDRDTILVMVNPLPTVSFTGAPNNACTNNPSITLTGSPVGGTFVGPGMNGNIFSPSAAGTGFKTVTYVYTNAQNCTNSFSKIIAVNDPPNVLFTGLGSTYCPENAASTLIGAPTGGVYTGPGISGNTFNPSTAGPGNHSIIYTYTDLNGCSNKDTNTTQVYQPVAVAISGLNTSYCLNSSIVQMSVNYTGGNFSGNGVSGTTFNPALAGVGTHLIKYLALDNHGCITGDTIMVTVNALPASVDFTGLGASYCANVDSILLSGVPSGGAFIGTGISGNYFRPLVAAPGTHQIKYTYTNGFGCSKSDSQTVVVNPLPSITISGLSTSYCLSNSNVNVSASPIGGSLTGSGIIGSVFSPSFAGVGNHYIKYAYTSATGCFAKDSVLVVVNALPIVNFNGLANNYCQNSPSTNLVGSPIGGTFVGTGISGTVFNPLNAGQGLQQITYNYTDLNGCTNSSIKNVTIFPIPVVNAGNDVIISQGSFASLNGSASGGSGSFNYAWSPANLVVSPNSQNTNTQSLNATQLFTLTVNDIGYGCQNTDQKNVIIQGGPLSATINATPTMICAGSTSQLAVSASGGTGTYGYAWSSNPSGFISSIPNPIVAPSVTTTYTCVVNDGPSSHSASFVLIVNPKPVVTLNGLAPSYCSNNSVVLVQTSPIGGILTGSGITGNIFNPAAASISTFNVIYSYTDIYGCSGSDTSLVTVKLAPTASAGQDTILPCGHPGVLIGQQPASGVTYSWSPILGLANPSASNTLASPNLSINYTLTATSNSNSCVAKDSILIEITGTPTALAIGDTTICPGDSVTLSASGGDSYLWATGQTTSSIKVAPMTTTAYWVIVSQGNCADADTVLVNVDVPNANLGNDTILCANAQLTLTATPGLSSYLWSNGSTQNSITIDTVGVGLGSHWYSVRVTNSKGCVGYDSLKVIFQICQGINDENALSLIQFYPNPSKGKVSMLTGYCTDQQLEIQILDLNGKVIEEQILESNGNRFQKDFDFTNKPKGVYMIKVRSHEASKVYRIIIQ